MDTLFPNAPQSMRNLVVTIRASVAFSLHGLLSLDHDSWIISFAVEYSLPLSPVAIHRNVCTSPRLCHEALFYRLHWSIFLGHEISLVQTGNHVFGTIPLFLEAPFPTPKLSTTKHLPSGKPRYTTRKFWDRDFRSSTCCFTNFQGLTTRQSGTIEFRYLKLSSHQTLLISLINK